MHGTWEDFSAPRFNPGLTPPGRHGNISPQGAQPQSLHPSRLLSAASRLVSAIRIYSAATPETPETPEPWMEIRQRDV
jgi:hypothetical protein